MTPFPPEDHPYSYDRERNEARAEGERTDTTPTRQEMRDERDWRPSGASGDGWKCRCSLPVLHEGECVS